MLNVFYCRPIYCRPILLKLLLSSQAFSFLVLRLDHIVQTQYIYYKLIYYLKHTISLKNQNVTTTKTSDLNEIKKFYLHLIHYITKSYGTSAFSCI